MRKINIYVVLVLSLVLGLSSCNPDDGPSLQDEAFELLEGEWTFGTTGSILLDGEDLSLNFPGFSLSFANGTYQTSNGGDLFRATGTWEWLNEEAKQITLDTGEEVTIVNLTESVFEFSFFHTGSAAAGIRGNYTIKVVK